MKALPIPEFFDKLLQIADNLGQLSPLDEQNGPTDLADDQFYTQIDTLIEGRTVTIEIILAIKSYVEKDAPAAPLYASAPSQAERLGKIAYYLSKGLPHPAPALACWLLANAYMFMEKSNDAVELYEQSQTDFLRKGDPDNYRTRLGVGYVAALALTGQPRRALTLASELDPLLRAKDIPENYISLLLNMGASHEMLGEYEEAFAIYQRQLPLAQQLEDKLLTARTRHNQANILLRMNLFQEALAVFREAEQGFKQQDATAELFRLYMNLSILYMQWGEYDRALDQLNHIEINLLQKDEDKLMPHWMTWLRTDIILRSDQYVSPDLLLALEQASGMFQRYGPVYYAGLVQLSLAQCAIQRQNWANARTALELARTIAESGVGLTLSYQAEHGLGQLVEAQNLPEVAATHYEEAIAQIETLRHTLLAEDFRAHFVADKLHVYQSLIRLYATNNQLSQAFYTTERIKSRLLAERLAFRLNNEAEALIADKDERVRSLAQQLQKTLNKIQQVSLTSQRVDKITTQPYKIQLEGLEKQVQELVGQIQRDQPLLSPLATGEVISTARLQSLLATYSPKAIFLQYQIIADHIWVLPITATEILSPIQLTPVTEVNHLRQSLYAAFMRVLQLNVRRGPEISARFLPALLGDTQDILTELHRRLIAPLLAAFPNKLLPETHLIISPDNILYYLPFHAFYDGVQYLLEQHVISYTPSGTVLDLCLQPSHEENIEQAHLFGYGGTDLVNVGRELAQVMSHLPHAQLYQDQDATTAQFMQSASDYNLLHMAAHAQFRPDNPLLSSIQMADRPLTLGEIARLPLHNCALAVLSGCETGYGQLQGADLLSLAGGFLGAGVRSLVVSLWRVDDESTSMLMDNFYRAFRAGNNRASSLRQAQLALLNQGTQSTDHTQLYRHPAYWAPFVLNGDWRTLTSKN